MQNISVPKYLYSYLEVAETFFFSNFCQLMTLHMSVAISLQFPVQFQSAFAALDTIKIISLEIGNSLIVHLRNKKLKIM